MRVDVLFVNMGADYVGVAPLQKALGQLAPDAVRLLRGYFAGLEGLTYVVGNHARLFAAGSLCVLTL